MNIKRINMGLAVLSALGAALCRAEILAPALKPPAADFRPHQIQLHGDTLIDGYFWLRDRSDPAVLAYLKAENAYADAVMAPTQAFQDQLYKEMVSRIKETDAEVPYPYRGYFYYSRTEQGKQYPIYCRKKGSLNAPEEILVNLNESAKGRSFMALGAYQVSDDGRYLAYTIDAVGFRQYTLYVKDLFSGKVLPDRAERVDDVAWAADNRTLFYTVEDAQAKRAYRLYRHRLGEAQDTVVYEEKDLKFELSLSRSRSLAYLFLGSASKTSTEYRYLEASRSEGPWQLLLPREPWHEYYPDHRGGLFYIRTNQGGRNFRLVTAPVSEPKKENWKEIVPHRPEVMLEGVLLFKDFYVLAERERGLPQLTVVDASGASRRVGFPDAAYEVSPEHNAEFAMKTLRYRYESFATPDSVYDYYMQAGTTKLLKRTEVPGYDPARYLTERVYATALDGTKIPISLLYLKGLKRDSSAGIYLTGYGAYGHPNPVSFNSNIFSLVDRGIVYAKAHVRGGGEMGKIWHEQGRMLNKKNTFTDFIAAGEHLLKEGYGAPRRLAIEGGSAGGLLIGAALNLRPDLFRAAILRVPFVDGINTMLDEGIPLTAVEFEEWGNPKIQAEYEYIKSYSPYDNLKAQDYPAILVKTSLQDSQVMYWEPAKYVAKLRGLKTGQNPVLLKTNMNAGHGGSSGRYDYLREVAFNYAFLLRQLGY